MGRGWLCPPASPGALARPGPTPPRNSGGDSVGGAAPRDLKIWPFVTESPSSAFAVPLTW